MLTWPALTAQTTPPTPDKVWTGDLGAGLALTSGNSDTRNFNLAFNLTRDPKTRNLIKSDATYLKGAQDGEDIIDRLTVGFRDEYTLSGRTFVFGEVRYLRDQFKAVDHLINPLGGIGYRLYRTDTMTLALSSGAGTVWEKNPGLDVGTSGSVNAGQDLSWKLSDTATLTQILTGLWKMDGFADSLYRFEIGLATPILTNVEIKIQFNNDYKNRPPSPTIKKNDQALITSFLYKF